MRHTHQPVLGARNAKAPLRGFTLVELLVVIAIIAILAGLLLVAAAGALGRGKEARIIAEMNQFNSALEDYKNTVGSYPPNAQVTGIATVDHLDNAAVLANFKRHLKKVAPNHREPPALINALCGFDANGNANPGTADGSILVGGMNAAEALVFWLGGFSDDPQYPISGSKGPSYSLQGITVLPNEADPIESRPWRLGIDVTELGPRTDTNFFNSDDNRFIVYDDPRNPGQQRRINFWYLKAPSSPLPYVYFDASRGSSAEATNDPPAAVLHMTTAEQYSDSALRSLYYVHAVKRRKSNADPDEPFVFANDGKFQILHGGLDERWGSLPLVDPMDATLLIDAEAFVDSMGGTKTASVLLYTDGPWTLDLADTIASFANGTLEDAQ